MIWIYFFPSSLSLSLSLPLHKKSYSIGEQGCTLTMSYTQLKFIISMEQVMQLYMGMSTGKNKQNQSSSFTCSTLHF